ncbi:hypothetical protein ES703_69867 [subsurface metagenome]
MDKKLTRIKQQISRLEYRQLSELSKYLSKKKEDAWKQKRAQEAIAHSEKIKSLPAGAKVVFADSRYDLCGEIGIIKRHLGRGSSRTTVDFGVLKIWNCPRRELSANISEENITRLKAARKASAAIHGIFFNAVGKTNRDIRPYCTACGVRLDKGESKRFKGKHITFTMHKFRKNCSMKTRWSKLKKQN